MMEFRDLKRQYQKHKEAIDNGVLSVIKAGNFIQGTQVHELEEKLAEYAGVKYCISCGNGTDALQLALMAWEIGSGDAVFVPDFTFFSSGEAVSLCGAFPVFVDIDQDTYNMSPDSLEKAISFVRKETDLTPRAVIAVDLFGQPADYQKIRKIVQKYDLLLLEDGAQGFGGMSFGKRACSFGDISTTSFFPAKPLGCYGDGGAIFTDNEEWAGVLRSLCVHGKGTDKYDNIRIGMNSRLDTIQAAVLLEKLTFFDQETDRCNAVAKEYTKNLKEVVKVPYIVQGMRSAWAQYTICAENGKKREELIGRLREKGIPSAVYYRKPLHLQKAFEKYRIENLDYGTTETICQNCLSLPMHPYMEKSEVDLVCSSVLEICQTQGC